MGIVYLFRIVLCLWFGHSASMFVCLDLSIYYGFFNHANAMALDMSSWPVIWPICHSVVLVQTEISLCGVNGNIS